MVLSVGKCSMLCDWFKVKGRSVFVMIVKSVLEEFCKGCCKVW